MPAGVASDAQGMKLASVTLAAACLAAGASVALAAPSSPPVHIYLSVPQGTPGAELIEQGVTSAIAARKAKAGKVRVKLIVMDDALNGHWDAGRAAANATRAAADPRAIAYIGEGDSGATAVAMPILNRAGIVHASPISTAVSLTAPENQATLQPTGTQTFFRSIPRDDQQAESLVKHIRDTGVGRVAIVDDGGMYGGGLADLVAAAAARRGVTVVARQTVPDGQVDAAALAASGADGVVVAMTPSTGGVGVAQAVHAALPSALIFSGDAMAQDSVAKRLGAVQKVMRLTAPAAHMNPRAAAGFGLDAQASSPFVVFSYNATMAVLNATRRASDHGPVTRASVRSAVFDGSLVPGLSGPWQVQPNGDGVVGVFDELRMERGRVLTPGHMAARKLRVCGTKVCMTNLTRKASAASAMDDQPSTDAEPWNLSEQDLYTLMMLGTIERAGLMNRATSEALAAVRDRIAEGTRLGVLLATLQSIRSRAGGAAAGTPIDIGGLSQDQRDALASPDILRPNSGWTVGTLDAAITGLTRHAEDVGNQIKANMVRLQALNVQNNEAPAPYYQPRKGR